MFAGHDAEYFDKYRDYGVWQLKAYLFAKIDAKTTQDSNGIKAAELLYKILKDEKQVKDGDDLDVLALIARDDTFIAPDEPTPSNPIL